MTDILRSPREVLNQARQPGKVSNGNGRESIGHTNGAKPTVILQKSIKPIKNGKTKSDAGRGKRSSETSPQGGAGGSASGSRSPGNFSPR